MRICFNFAALWPTLLLLLQHAKNSRNIRKPNTVWLKLMALYSNFALKEQK